MSEKTPKKTESESKPKPKRKSSFVLNYVGLVAMFTVLILFFSIVMAGVSSYRNDISQKNYDSTSEIYNGRINQIAPKLDYIHEEDSLYLENSLNKELIKRYLDNTFLTKTTGDVNIKADFVKKGLVYQPSYKTEFMATYVLENTLDEESFVSFQFPFPTNTSSSEISNATLIVNGEEISNAKTQISSNSGFIDGLKWNGKIPAKSEVSIDVSYNTVGLSSFIYEGLENSSGSQDLDFTVTIDGSRAYDVNSGLSVDDREFGDNSVTLKWEKSDLYSKPLINVSIGDKLNPSQQVSRVYLTMAPIYLVFISVLLYLAYKFGRKIGSFDLFLVTILFAIFFPLVHYLSSFTIDPTVEVFSTFDNVMQFSMPLYGAFALSWVIVGGLMYYLLGKTSGFRFATKFAIPTMILFIGFFPLVVTIPEYSMLLVLIGAVALLAIIIQVRIKLLGETKNFS